MRCFPYCFWVSVSLRICSSLFKLFFFRIHSPSSASRRVLLSIYCDCCLTSSSFFISSVCTSSSSCVSCTSLPLLPLFDSNSSFALLSRASTVDCETSSSIVVTRFDNLTAISSFVWPLLAKPPNPLIYTLFSKLPTSIPKKRCPISSSRPSSNSSPVCASYSLTISVFIVFLKTLCIL